MFGGENRHGGERLEEGKAGNSIVWIYKKENVDHSTCNMEL